MAFNEYLVLQVHKVHIIWVYSINFPGQMFQRERE